MNDYTTRISCSCDTCKANAEHVGAGFPLGAAIRPVLAANLGITIRNCDKAAKVHRLVHIAYDPQIPRTAASPSVPSA